MPQKTKKGPVQVRRDDIVTAAEVVDEKENRCSNPQKTKNKKDPVEVILEEKQSKNLNEASLAPKVKTKTFGFWSKKLQDLEENETKNKKCGLYEFSETDSSFKIKNKRKPKARIQNKRQPAVLKYNILIEKKKKFLELEKMKPTHKAAPNRRKIIVTKEEGNLGDRAEKFGLSIHKQSFGITSTPDVNKKNLIGASDFQFLSPISKEEAVQSDSILESMAHKTKADDNCIINLGPETPKVETKLKRISCRRVLRSGKVTGA